MMTKEKSLRNIFKIVFIDQGFWHYRLPPEEEILAKQMINNIEDDSAPPLDVNLKRPILVNGNKKTEQKTAPLDIPIDDTKYDLSELEEGYLLAYMDFYKDATPRQIRILYYRYLLGRNLLINQFQALEMKMDAHVLDDLCLFLLHYSTLEDGLTKLKSTKINLIENEGIGVTLMTFGSNNIYNTQQAIEIHKVLEIVIAY